MTAITRDPITTTEEYHAQTEPADPTALVKEALDRSDAEIANTQRIVEGKTLTSRIQVLEEALRPFAAEIDDGGFRVDSFSSELTDLDFRRARSALDAMNSTSAVNFGGDWQVATSVRDDILRDLRLRISDAEKLCHDMVAKFQTGTKGASASNRWKAIKNAAYNRSKTLRGVVVEVEAAFAAAFAAASSPAPSASSQPLPVIEGVEPDSDLGAVKWYVECLDAIAFQRHPIRGIAEAEQAYIAAIKRLAASEGQPAVAAPVTEEVEQLRRERADVAADRDGWRRLHDWAQHATADRNAALNRVSLDLAAAETARDALQARVEGLGYQCEWLKARVAELQLPQNSTYDREQFLLDCGMPALFPSSTPAEAGQEQSRVEALESGPVWGRWYRLNEAPAGSYPCLYKKGEEEVTIAWMPASGRPIAFDMRIMPFHMPDDVRATQKGDAA